MKQFIIIFFLVSVFFTVDAQLTTQKKIVSRLQTTGIKSLDLKSDGLLLISNFNRDSLIYTSLQSNYKKRGTYLIRLNSNFDTLWTKIIYNLNTNDCLFNKDNEIILVGVKYGINASICDQGLNVLKLNLNGVVLKSVVQPFVDLICNFSYEYFDYNTYANSAVINEYKDNRYVIFLRSFYGASFIKINENFDLISQKYISLNSSENYYGLSSFGIFKVNDSTLLTSLKANANNNNPNSIYNNSILVFDTLLNFKKHFKIANGNYNTSTINVINNKVFMSGYTFDNEVSFFGNYGMSFLTSIDVMDLNLSNKRPLVKYRPSYARKIQYTEFLTTLKTYNNKLYLISNDGFLNNVNDSTGLNNRKYLFSFDTILNVAWKKRLHLFNMADTLPQLSYNTTQYLNIIKNNEFIFKDSNIILTNYDAQQYSFFNPVINRNSYGFNISKIDTNGKNALCNATDFELVYQKDSIQFESLPIPNYSFLSTPFINNTIIIENLPLQKIVQKCLPLLPPKSKFRVNNLDSNGVVCLNSQIDIDEFSYNEPKTWNWIFPPQVNVSTLDSLYLPYIRSISFTEAGVFPIKLVTTNDAGSDTSTQYITVVNFIPQPNLGNDTILCLGDTLRIIYIDPPNSSHYFSFSSLFSTSDTLLITNNGEFFITTITTCGNLYDTINVKFAANPKANFGFTNTCNNLNVIFTDSSLLNFNPSLTYTYAYKPALAPASAYTNFATVGNTNFSFPSFDSFDVRLIVRSPLSCAQQDTIVKRIVLSPKPIAGFTYNNNCGSRNVAIANNATITAGSISSYQYFLNGVATSNNANFIFNVPNFGAYNLQQVVTSSAGCVSDTFSLPIIVKAKPIVSVTTLKDSVCQNANYTLTANATVDASTITNYTWLKNNMPIINNTNIQTENNTTGIYTYKLVAQAATGCNSDTATKTITIASKPTATINAINICGSKQINITSIAIVTNDNINNYYIDYGDGNNNNNNPNNTTYSYANFGNYTLKFVVKGSAGCQSDTAFFTINVKDKPTATINYNNNACQNTNYTLTANTTVNNSSITNYTWLKNNIVQANNTNTQTENNLANNYTYQLITTAANGCQSDTATQLVTVQKYATINFTATNGCANTLVIITNSSINNNTNNATGLNYLWATNDGQTSTNLLPNFSFANAGTKTITLKASTSNNCADSATKIITIEDKPIANFTINEACLGKPLNLNNNSTGSITNYIWATNNGQSSIATTPNFIFNNTGSYTINLTVSTLNNCTNAKTETVNIQAVQLFTTPAVDTNAVVNQPIQLNISGAATYTWQPATNLNNSNINNPIFNASTAGVYNYQIQGTTAQGCKGNANIKINVFAANNYLLIPNAFTPNADGLNDRLRITCTGLQKLNYFTIYNRWGNMVYTQTNCNQNGWDGKLKGVLQPNATFVYNWSGVDFLGKKVSGKGTVTLLR